MSREMKYIVFENPVEEEIMVIFPTKANHDDVANRLKDINEFGCVEVVRAGFFYIDLDTNEPEFHGCSTSLNVTSDPKKDKMLFNFGGMI